MLPRGQCVKDLVRVWQCWEVVRPLVGGPRKKSLCHLEYTYGRRQDGVPWLLPLLPLRPPSHKKTHVSTRYSPPLSSGTPFRGYRSPPSPRAHITPPFTNPPFQVIHSSDGGANSSANQSPPQSHRLILAFWSSLGFMFSLVFIHSWVKPRLSALTVPSNNLRRFLV